MIESPTRGGVGNTMESSSSTIIADGGGIGIGCGGGGGGGGGGMTIAAHTIHTAITSTIADGLLHTIAHWKILLLGQCISILVAIAGGTNDVLALECGVSAPSTYNALGYALVAIVGFIQLSRARGSMTNTVGNDSNSGNNNNDETDRAESEQERTSFREGSGSSFVGDLHHLDHDHHDGNDEDFDYDDDDEDDDELDDLTLDDSITKRSSFFFSLRRNSNNNHDNTDKQFHQDTRRERYPPPPSHTHNNRSISAANSVKNKHHTHVNATNLPSAKWYYYFTIAFVEAQAFYFVFMAFRYTSFTFVYVSDALAIPSAMIFSRLFMKRKYLRTHILGCLICITGIVVNTASDINHNAKENNAGGGGGGLRDVVASLDHVKGDIFAILGAILLGLDDVLSEMILDNYGGGVSKMLFMKGMFGTLISLVQLGIFERENVYLLFGVDDSIEASSSYPCELPWRMTLLTAHVTSRALGVAGEMQFLFISEATLLNILLLTSDLFAAFFDILTDGFRLTPYFCIAFLCIVIGIVLYEAGPSPAAAEDGILGVGGTPVTIEFRDRGKRNRNKSSTTMPPPPTSSLMCTEHAGNLSPSGILDRELT